MEFGIHEGESVISVSYQDGTGQRLVIHKSVVVRTEDVSNIFPYAPDGMLALVMEKQLPPTHYPPPRHSCAEYIFLDRRSGSCVYLDENSQPRHVDIEVDR